MTMATRRNRKDRERLNDRAAYGRCDSPNCSYNVKHERAEINRNVCPPKRVIKSNSLQFAVVQEEFGKNRSATVNFNKVSNVATAGGTLVESAPVPKTQVTITQGTLTLTEYGLGVNITGKVKSLSELNVDNMITKALKNDQVKVLDAAVESQMDACDLRYVGYGTSSGVWCTAGTATNTATSNLNAYHVKNIIDKMMGTYNVPPCDGEYFFGILTVTAARGLHDDLESVWKSKMGRLPQYADGYLERIAA